MVLASEALARAREQRAAQLAAVEKRRAAGQRQRGRAARVDDYCRVREAAAQAGKAQAAAAARAGQPASPRRRRKKDKHGQPVQPARNITDPHSRLMPVRGGGFIQGYNPQNVTSEDGLIIATELTADAADTAWFEPMLRQAEDAARLITAHRPPAAGPPPAPQAPAPGQPPSTGAGSLITLFLSDAGYLSEHNLTVDGPDRLIATGKTRDLEKAARDGGTASRGRTGPATTAMAARLATEDGITAYRQRGHIAETPHGVTRHAEWARMSR